MCVVEHFLHAVRACEGSGSQVIDVEFGFRPIQGVVKIGLRTPKALINNSLMEVELFKNCEAVSNCLCFSSFPVWESLAPLRLPKAIWKLTEFRAF